MRAVVARRVLAGLAALAIPPSAFADLKLDRVLGGAPPNAQGAVEGPATPFALRLDAGVPAAEAPLDDTMPLQPLIADVRVNEQDKGEQVVYLRGTDDFYVGRQALGEWLKVPDDAPTRELEGQPFVALSSLRGVRWRFDEAKLLLRLEAPPDAFPAQRFAYVTGVRAPLTPSTTPSALLNYRAGWFHTGVDGVTTWSLNTEARLHWGDWLFTHQQYTTHGGGQAGSFRGYTAFVRDDPARLARLYLGDAPTYTEDLAGGTVIGGVTYAKAYELDPYLIRQPTASFRTLVDTPSTIDVYAGGNRIYRQAVAPGPVEVGNLSYLLGQRDLRVVVRDAFGRERQLELPFYFGARALAPGLQDFSYSVGAVRESVGVPGDEYGASAFSAAHRIGVNDALTLGARAEGMRDFVTAGPSLVLRHHRLGELSLAYLATRDRDRPGTPHAWAAAYSWIDGGFSVFLASRRADRGFRIVQPSGSLGPVRESDAASLSYSRERWGTFSVFGRRQVDALGLHSRDVGAGYSIPFRRDLTLQLTYRRSEGLLATREIFLGVQYIPAPNLTAIASARDESGARTVSLQAGSLLPEGVGAAYRVTAEATRQDGLANERLEPEVVYQGRFGTLEGRVLATRGDNGSSTTHSGALSGALAYVGGHVGMTRPIDDSFAVVRIEPPIEGVRVRLNQQEIGRTGARGEVFIPRVVAYVENHVAIDDRDVPIDRALAEKTRMLVPSIGRGDVVSFAAPPIRAVSGVLRVSRGGVEAPVELTVFTVQARGGPVDVPVGRGGEFYAENLPAGRYAARLDVDGQGCEFTINIPESDEPFVRLPPLVACSIR